MANTSHVYYGTMGRTPNSSHKLYRAVTQEGQQDKQITGEKETGRRGKGQTRGGYWRQGRIEIPVQGGKHLQEIGLGDSDKITARGDGRYRCRTRNTRAQSGCCANSPESWNRTRTRGDRSWYRSGSAFCYTRVRHGTMRGASRERGGWERGRKLQSREGRYGRTEWSHRMER